LVAATLASEDIARCAGADMGAALGALKGHAACINSNQNKSRTPIPAAFENRRKASSVGVSIA
jgi:hypothetical protein